MEMDPRSCGTLGGLGTFLPSTAVEGWWGLTWGLKAQPRLGALFIVYLLFGCHHQRGGGGQQRMGSSPAACRKNWLKLLWAGTPTKPSRMELAKPRPDFFQ